MVKIILCNMCKAMLPEEVQTGLYQEIVCPYCGRRITFCITLHQLKPQRIKFMGLIKNILNNNEFAKFESLDTANKILFSVGKFFDEKKKWPSETELAHFTGFTEQTISKYLKELKTQGYVTDTNQKRDMHGHFTEKQFSLTYDGQQIYSQLIYEISEKFVDKQKIYKDS